MNPVYLIRLADLSLRLGRTHRATVHPDGKTPESDTDHTHMLGLLCMELMFRSPLLSRRLNAGRVLLLVQVHDLLEAYTGDVDTCGWSSRPPEERIALQLAKDEQEARALRTLRENHALSPWMLEAIDDYMDQRTAESNFVLYVDKLCPRLANLLSGGAAVLARGMSADELARDHSAQRQQLALRFPNLAPTLDPVFAAVCEAEVTAYRDVERVRRELDAILVDANAPIMRGPWEDPRFAWGITQGHPRGDFDR